MEVREWRRQVLGPFRIDQLPTRSSYELTNGHPIRSAPFTVERASCIVRATRVLSADPSVCWVGARVGYALSSLILRCPDVVAESDGARLSPMEERHALKLSTALMLSSDPQASWVSLWGAPTSEPSPIEALSRGAESPSWTDSAPSLAIEIVEAGRDEDDLAQKIDELLCAGTRHLWAIRLTGPRRVEAYSSSISPKTFSVGRELEAEDVLRLSVPVEAFFEDDKAAEHVLESLASRG